MLLEYGCLCQWQASLCYLLYSCAEFSVRPRCCFWLCDALFLPFHFVLFFLYIHKTVACLPSQHGHSEAQPGQTFTRQGRRQDGSIIFSSEWMNSDSPSVCCVESESCACLSFLSFCQFSVRHSHVHSLKFFLRRSNTARWLPVDSLSTFSFHSFKLSEQNELLRFNFNAPKIHMYNLLWATFSYIIHYNSQKFHC